MKSLPHLSYRSLKQDILDQYRKAQEIIAGLEEDWKKSRRALEAMRSKQESECADCNRSFRESIEDKDSAMKALKAQIRDLESGWKEQCDKEIVQHESREAELRSVIDELQREQRKTDELVVLQAHFIDIRKSRPGEM